VSHQHSIVVLSILLSLPGERKLLEEPEEKTVARLGITYGVLRRLGFSQHRVDECLRAIQGVDLEEAYEWVHLFPAP
jgi:ATP-dependent RNA helicase DHX29